MADFVVANDDVEETEESSTSSQRSSSSSYGDCQSNNEVEVIEEIFTKKASIRRLEDAMARKEEGNTFFRDKNYESAVFSILL